MEDNINNLEQSNGKGFKNKRTNENFFIELIKIVIISFFFFVIITTQIARKTQVDGASMVPTLEDGDQVIINVLATKVGTVDRFDIVVFQSVDSYLVKRIIGLPNETIELRSDKLFVNGVEVDQPFLDTEFLKSYREDNRGRQFTTNFKVTLKEDEYFVLGDNRPHSKDSRSSEIGNITKDDMVGLGGFIIYPFNRIGVVK